MHNFTIYYGSDFYLFGFFFSLSLSLSFFLSLRLLFFVLNQKVAVLFIFYLQTLIENSNYVLIIIKKKKRVLVLLRVSA